VVRVIDEEAEEDLMRIVGASDTDFHAPAHIIAWQRVRWLVVTLINTMIAATVISQFQDTIQHLVALAVLMPIVAGVGGNAGTQTLAVTVRAIATNQLTGSNRWRAVGRELRVAMLNGLTIALLIGAGVTLVLGSMGLGAVIAAAMLINIIVAGLAGVLVPLTLERAGADPAVASSVFVTMVTDSMGFLLFLGFATASGVIP